jgi:hypothetical protein
MQGTGFSREPLANMPGGALWQRSRTTDAADDEMAHFLDLASFADQLLDADECERVAEWLAQAPVAAADVAAAQAIGGVSAAAVTVPEAVVARACALVGGIRPTTAVIIPFRERSRVRPKFLGMARWCSLAAAVAVAGWLGFTLGVDTSRSLAPTAGPAAESSLQEMLDPATGALADLTDGAQS